MGFSLWKPKFFHSSPTMGGSGAPGKAALYMFSKIVRTSSVHSLTFSFEASMMYWSCLYYRSPQKDWHIPGSLSQTLHTSDIGSRTKDTNDSTKLQMKMTLPVPTRILFDLFTSSKPVLVCQIRPSWHT